MTPEVLGLVRVIVDGPTAAIALGAAFLLGLVTGLGYTLRRMR